MQEDFIGLASHELRSPLTSVQGFAQWLDRRVSEDPEAYDEQSREAISTMRRDAERMGSTLRLFTQLASMQAGQFEPETEPVSLVPLLEEEAETQRRAYPDLTLTESYANRSIVVISDDARIREIVTNLLQNAVRHGGEGVSVHLSLDVDDEAVRIRVKDDGPGIAAEIRPYIFERRRSTQTRGGRLRPRALHLS